MSNQLKQGIIRDLEGKDLSTPNVHNSSLGGHAH